jgi:hypothetical protein
MNGPLISQARFIEVPVNICFVKFIAPQTKIAKHNAVERNLNMTKGGMPVGLDRIDIEIRLAIQRLVEKGLVFDTGRKRWSERSGRYETVWAGTGLGETRQ